MEEVLARLQLDGVDAVDLAVNVSVLAIALLFSMPVAWDREKSTRAMGLRTFPLVAVASAAFVLVGRAVIGDGDPDAHARVIQGLVAGIGFIGGGAILKKGDRVLGAATAAAIWATAGIGLAVAHGLYAVAGVLSLLSFAVLRLLRPVKEAMNGNDQWADGVSDEEEAT